jgi:16S rRNA (cytosine967-C5)-methyltransferase
MTPAARVEAAIEIVDGWRDGSEGLDRMLTRWGRTHRFAGSGDRHAIADLVHDAMRRMRSALWVAGVSEPGTGRDLLRGSLLLDDIDPRTLFTGERYAPPPLGEGEHRPARPLGSASRPVRLDFPDWLAEELAGTEDRVLEAMRARAPLDLRVNLLKTRPAEAVAALARENIAAAPAPLSPTALRVRSGQRRVAASRAYRDGLVEIQDAASQAAVDLAAARPGETVLDLCAGGGGKTLALAAAMEGRGRLCAHDIAPRRMAALPERARRAGAAVEIVETPELVRLHGACDLVFVDAPCSGSGAWRRNPEGKWRLRPEDLERMTATQDALLLQAIALLAPGGRIVYATCSILARENDARVETLLRGCDRLALRHRLSLTPLDGGDGFYAAVIGRRSAGTGPVAGGN